MEVERIPKQEYKKLTPKKNILPALLQGLPGPFDHESGAQTT